MNGQDEMRLPAHERRELAYRRALAGQAPARETFIDHNGSKWAGEAPDSIDVLVRVLSEHTLQAHWDGAALIRDAFPSGVPDCYARFTHHFCGNFVEVSHGFSIYSNDPDVIALLLGAVAANVARRGRP